MTKAYGFSLVEILLVLLVLGILLTVGGMGLNQYLQNMRLQEARQLLSQELMRARSDARKTSSDQMVSWSNGVLNITGSEVKFPGGVSLKTVTGNDSGSLTYAAPFGRLGGANAEFVLEDRRGRQAVIRLVGVTGKVVYGD